MSKPGAGALLLSVLLAGAIGRNKRDAERQADERRRKEVEDRTPEWMKPFAKVDMFGRPTVFSPDFGRLHPSPSATPSRPRYPRGYWKRELARSERKSQCLRPFESKDLGAIRRVYPQLTDQDKDSLVSYTYDVMHESNSCAPFMAYNEFQCKLGAHCVPREPLIRLRKLGLIQVLGGRLERGNSASIAPTRLGYLIGYDLQLEGWRSWPTHEGAFSPGWVQKHNTQIRRYYY